MSELLICAFNQKATRNKCVGYCKLHRCYLTEKQVKNMHCLQKNCKHLKRLEHQFWVIREKIKQMRKQKYGTRIDR